MIVAILALSFYLLPANAIARPAPKIKIRVHQGLDTVWVSGVDLKRKIHPNNDVKVYKGLKRIRFNCNNLEHQAKNPLQRPVLLASLGSPTGLLSLKKSAIAERYKGLLHIVASPLGSSCDVVYEARIEDYLASLLAKEMNAKWPIEALRAQAVAARTYALYKRESRQVNRLAGHETFYHLENSEKHQVSGHFLESTNKTWQASLSTKGEVLLDPDQSIKPVFFHAKCGGHTLRPDQVWQNTVRGYQAVSCPFCKERGPNSYRTEIPIHRFKNFLTWLGKKGHSSKISPLHLEKKIKLAPHQRFSRNLSVLLGNKVIHFKKALLRRYFGRKLVPSNNFRVALNSGKIKTALRLTGDGLGHGVGMCQMGAFDLAERGWDYKRILSYYFPNFSIEHIY